MTPPPVDVLKHIGDRLMANDIAWFKSRFAAGEFAWLRGHLPEGGYTTLGEHIEAGDLAYVRRLLAGLDLPVFGASAVGESAVAAVPTTGATTNAAAALQPVADASQSDRRKKDGVWLLPIALLVALGLGFWLSHLGKDDTSTAATPETTVAVVEESVAPATEPVATEAPAAPTTNILETAKAAGGFTTLVAAVNAAGLGETLNGTGPFTVFAPTDDAFSALPAGVVDALLKSENKGTLAKILTYHVVPGTVRAADIKAGNVATVEGSTVKLTTEGGVTVNDAKVLTADIATSNGVIHVIDKVLLPPGIDVAALLKPATGAAGDLTTTNRAGDATPEDLTVYFDRGSAQISAAGQAKIDAAVTVLSAAPAGTKVALVGRADKTGDAAANLALSKRRAAAVQAALVRGLADKASQVTVTADAKGDAEQINDLAFARRVTIEIAK